MKTATANGDAQQRTKGSRLFLWLAVSVGFSLFPLAANYINGRIGGNAPDLIDLLAGGELFLITAALTADGIGRAFLGGKRYQRFRISCAIGCLALLTATSFYFGRVAFAIEEQRSAVANAIQRSDLRRALEVFEHPGVDRKVIAHDSLGLFAFALIASFGLILVEED